MTKLKGASLQDIAATLCSTETVNGKQLTNVKGGCSSCEDKRRPPVGWSSIGGNNQSGNWSGNY
jgi:hypothetical protein